ncbi:integrase/recombinase XerD [Clostridium pascui]|uniref:tyrosine-type recombinase/integrase n=1 Tax=Clostridium pascui TaxID=46609 RepID=UPI00195CEE38|nr:tyrosine-type recombinase/integrase [Clostridium pascui]MBM7869264.1 integrase/recombinase XerD [Clostridium pascui]
MQINDILEEFIFDIEIKNFSKKSLKNYKNNNRLFFNYLLQEFKIADIEEVKPMHIKKYFKFLMKKSLTPSYANVILKNIRAFFKYCLEEEYIEENPCLKVGWQKEGKVIINTFNDKEILGLLDAFKFTTYLSARNKMIMAFLVDTGVRSNETCTLLNEDVKERIILIRGKGNKQRQVAISTLLKKYMIRYERIRDFYFKDKIIKFDNYFLSRNGRALTTESIERIVKEAGKIAEVREEIRCSPHTIRHWHAQEQLRNGLDVYSLSRLLGHESITITRRYLESIKDEDIVDLSVKTSPLMNMRGGRR